MCLVVSRFGYIYRKDQKTFNKEPDKPRFNLPGLKDRLRKAMKADHTKLAVKMEE